MSTPQVGRIEFNPTTKDQSGNLARFFVGCNPFIDDLMSAHKAERVGMRYSSKSLADAAVTIHEVPDMSCSPPHVRGKSRPDLRKRFVLRVCGYTVNSSWRRDALLPFAKDLRRMLRRLMRDFASDRIEAVAKVHPSVTRDARIIMRRP